MEKIFNGKKLFFSIKLKLLENIVYMNSMFNECKTLISLTDISYINTKYIKDINSLFKKCSNLKILKPLKT